MALTDLEKAYIHESAREVAREIITDVIIAHTNACPHGKMLVKAKWVIVGLCLGSAAAGGGGLVAGLLSLMG
ncbi:hypothetical protein LCGC14_1638850 [marine sediment metagenome]|uniref:Uncharacterized protein n=1 Tax=marine sediment metagenome TaxID=412755 RepID=A0A0F9KZT1_9ZZZZ